MMTPKQKWAIAGLVPVCLAVWVPQFLNNANTSSQVTLDEPTEAELMGIDDMPGDPGAAQRGTQSQSGGSGHSGITARGGDGAGSVLDRSRGLLVADVLKSLGASEAFRVPGSKSDALVQGMNTEGIGNAEVLQEIDSPMVSFVKDNPLRGTMAGEGNRLAVFGSYRVTEGDFLPGTGAIVAEIRRTRVRIEEAGMSLDVTLPPLTSRPATASNAATANQELNAGGVQVPSDSLPLVSDFGAVSVDQ